MTTTTQTDAAVVGGAHRSVDGDRVLMHKAGAGIVRANEVEINTGGAGLIIGGDQVRLDRAGARTIIAGGPLTMNRAGAGMVITAGDARIYRGGMPNLVALGEVKLQRSGALLALTRRATLGRGGFIGVAFAPRVQVEDGGRVLLGLREIAAMGVVAAVVTSLAFGLSKLLRPAGVRKP